MLILHSSYICRNPHLYLHLSRKQFLALFTNCTLNPLASAICLSLNCSASTATSTYLASTHSSLLQCRIALLSNPDTLETISITLSKKTFSFINKTAIKLFLSQSLRQSYHGCYSFLPVRVVGLLFHFLAP